MGPPHVLGMGNIGGYQVQGCTCRPLIVPICTPNIYMNIFIPSFLNLGMS